MLALELVIFVVVILVVVVLELVIPEVVVLPVVVNFAVVVKAFAVVLIKFWILYLTLPKHDGPSTSSYSHFPRKISTPP